LLATATGSAGVAVTACCSLEWRSQGPLFVSYSQSRSGDLASPSPELAATMEEHGVVPPLSVYVET